jgi:hypothetical protein
MRRRNRSRGSRASGNSRHLVSGKTAPLLPAIPAEKVRSGEFKKMADTGSRSVLFALVFLTAVTLALVLGTFLLVRFVGLQR